MIKPFDVNTDYILPVQFAKHYLALSYKELERQGIALSRNLLDWYTNWIGGQRYIGRTTRIQFRNYFYVVPINNFV